MRIKFLLPVLALAVACCKTAPVSTDKQSADAHRYVNMMSEEHLRKDLTVVASDEMEGRETGSEGQKKAGLYLISRYKEIGVSHPPAMENYYQPVPASYLNARRNLGLPDSENILAYIPGLEFPNEIVVISAHYDHVGIINGEIYNGADDDGSGTVALVEMARVFSEAKKNGHGPKRSLLFLHVTGEEHGLHGSRYYAENPVFPIANTVANINIDMIGRRDTEHPNTNQYLYVIGADRLSSELDPIIKAQNERFTKLDLNYKFNDRNDPNRFYFRSDHYNFARKGVPSVFFFSGVHDDYHKPSDVVEKIEFDGLLSRARLAFAVAWEIANRDKRLAADRDGN